MSHEGAGRHSAPDGSLVRHSRGVPAVATVGALVPGDVLGERYRLDEQTDTDNVGRQIWRGTDLVLNRPVAVVIRHPGGEAAAPMLAAALAASRLTHPNLVAVYDAVDEDSRAYLVREWVSGVALRDLLRLSPLDADRAAMLTYAVADAVAALHAAGIAHGNIHPGTIMVADDGRVVLTDAHADSPVQSDADVRAVGAVLYACLTSHWPYAEAGHSTLPDAVRDTSGRLAAPRQVRGGVPRYLDELTTDLLDQRTPPPAAAAVAAEFARIVNHDRADFDDEHSPVGFGHDSGRRRAAGKLLLGLVVIAAVVATGVFIGANVLSRAGSAGQTEPPPATSSVNATPPSTIAVAAGQVRVVDPPSGDRTEMAGIENVVDGDETTGWSTDSYNRTNFGGLKPGMGILIDFGKPTAIGAVRVVVNQQGASVELRTGTNDPGATSAGDDEIRTSYQPLGSPLADHGGTVMVFPVPQQQQTMRYLLVWITELPAKGDGRFGLTVNEVTVLAP